MKRNVFLWQLCGFAAITLSGTLLHFLYEFSGENIIFSPISGVNESTWEHMKLLYFPMLVFALFQSGFFGMYKGFATVKLIGTVTGLSLIPIIFYTYNGAVGKSPDAVNIAIFFVAAGVALAIEGYLLKRDAFSHTSPVLPTILLLTIGVLFVVFTYHAPRLPLFRDPITGAYGIA